MEPCVRKQRNTSPVEGNHLGMGAVKEDMLLLFLIISIAQVREILWFQVTVSTRRVSAWQLFLTCNLHNYFNLEAIPKHDFSQLKETAKPYQLRKNTKVILANREVQTMRSQKR